MTKLTEHTVLARTRAQDLKSVRKLNAWGSELTDVSIVKKLPNVEVLSLSVNSISSLEDFSHCSNLQELYIRKNNITELGEIRHLKDLPKLKNLWLADNPCAECDDYRLTVIRVLPQLQKLDNMPVRPDEVESAKKHGSPLEALLPKAEEPTMTSPVAQQMSMQNSLSYEENAVTSSEAFIESSVISPSTQNNCNESVHLVQNSMRVETVNHSAQSTFEKTSPEYSYSYSEMQEKTQQINSSNSVDVLSPGSCNHSGSFAVKSRDSFEREVVPDLEPFPDTPTGSSKEHFSPNRGFPPPYSSSQRSTPRCERPTAIRMLPKGGKSRAANILSAVLCLIKELDWASLEVVDTAIHCQMEEMEEHHSS